MSSCAVHLAILQDHNLVCVYHRGNPLGNNNLGHILPLRQRLPDFFLRCSIYRACGIIKNQNLRLSHQRSRDTKSLLLATGKVACALLQHGIQTIWHPVQELICARSPAGLPDFLICRLWISPFQVVTHRSKEQHIFLQDNAHRIP